MTIYQYRLIFIVDIDKIVSNSILIEFIDVMALCNVSETIIESIVFINQILIEFNAKSFIQHIYSINCCIGIIHTIIHCFVWCN